MAEQKRAEILDTAKRCVVGDRDSQYGSPKGSFEEIAFRWSHYLSRTSGHTILLDEHDVAIMMTEFKISRIMTSNGKSEDSYVDACGYLSIAGELASEKNGE